MNYYSDNESLKFYLQHPDIEKIATLRENNFEEAGKYPDAPANVQEAVDDIIRGSHAMICINDSYSDEYELLSQTIRNAFQKRYPN